MYLLINVSVKCGVFTLHSKVHIYYVDIKRKLSFVNSMHGYLKKSILLGIKVSHL